MKLSGGSSQAESIMGGWVQEKKWGVGGVPGKEMRGGPGEKMGGRGGAGEEIGRSRRRNGGGGGSRKIN